MQYGRLTAVVVVGRHGGRRRGLGGSEGRGGVKESEKNVVITDVTISHADLLLTPDNFETILTISFPHRCVCLPATSPHLHRGFEQVVLRKQI
jgi:hypothetical protein